MILAIIRLPADAADLCYPGVRRPTWTTLPDREFGVKCKIMKISCGMSGFGNVHNIIDKIPLNLFLLFNSTKN